MIVTHFALSGVEIATFNVMDLCLECGTNKW
jgi:hypothetical protein